MNYTITASREGTAGPFVISPLKFAENLYKHLKENGQHPTYPKNYVENEDSPPDMYIQVLCPPKDLDTHITSFLESLGVEYEKTAESPCDDYLSINWYWEQ